MDRARVHLRAIGVPPEEIGEVTGHSWRALGATLLFQKCGCLETVARAGDWVPAKLGSVMRYVRRNASETFASAILVVAQGADASSSN